MKRVVLFLILPLVLATSCKKEVAINYMTNQKALEYFKSVEAYCNSEIAQLWGVNLYGPVLIVNPDTREIYSNFQDAEGLLKPKDGIFVGTYPKESIDPILALEYGGTQYGMVRLRRSEDPNLIQERMVHALFHCFQANNKLDYRGSDTSHLSEHTARLWVKLEWKALNRAIRTSGETRVQAIRDALIFRSARREMYPEYVLHENHFEIFEGLTTFTYSLICNESYEAYVRKLLNYYDRIYNGSSYTLSWGFLNGALYGHLLYESDFDFTTLVAKDFDLGQIIGEVYNITLPEISRDVAGSLAINYDIDGINREEADREMVRKENIRKKVAKYTEKPVIYIDLESPYFSYEPDEVDLVDSIGIIYNTLRVTDNWGRISVDDGGCLVSPNLDFLRVPARNIETDKNHIIGEGWHLILNDSWELVPYEENYIVRKLIP